MSDFSWMDEEPSKESKARVLHAADVEIDRYARVAQAAPRRGFFSFLSVEMLAAIPVAGVAGLLGFWLGSDDQTKGHGPVAAKDGPSDATDLIDDSLEEGDVEIVSNLEFFEDFDLLEALKDEELPS